ncbi:hypothetical protein D3C80_1383570 [compost metagenome]
MLALSFPARSAAAFAFNRRAVYFVTAPMCLDWFGRASSRSSEQAFISSIINCRTSAAVLLLIVANRPILSLSIRIGTLPNRRDAIRWAYALKTLTSALYCLLSFMSAVLDVGIFAAKLSSSIKALFAAITRL